MLGAEIIRRCCENIGAENTYSPPNTVGRLSRMKDSISRGTESIGTSNLIADIALFERDWLQFRIDMEESGNWAHPYGNVDGAGVDSAFSETKAIATERTRFLTEATKLNQSSAAGLTMGNKNCEIVREDGYRREVSWVSFSKTLRSSF